MPTAGLLTSTAIHRQLIRVVAGGAILAILSVSNTNIERAEDGDCGAHYCGAALGRGPDEHWNGVICFCKLMWQSKTWLGEDVQMYSDASRPDSATVRTIPHTPALAVDVC